MRLTKREYQCLVLRSEGESVQGVADILGISPATVRGYTKSMHLKLGARNAAHAVALAFQSGILHG